MSLNAQNEILQIMALKVLCGIASDITESGHCSIMADESVDASNIEQLVVLHMLGGQGDESMRGIYWSDASCSDKYRYNCHLHQICPTACESQNSRCSWEVIRWMFNHDWNQKWIAAQIKKLDEKCLPIHCYCHSLNLAVGDTIKNIHC